MNPVEFETSTAASELPQTQAWNRAATGMYPNLMQITYNKMLKIISSDLKNLQERLGKKNVKNN